jgi:uncharacterized protein YbjT (DUF2867 family)
MKAFVAGATGQTGRRIVQELVHRNIAVCALVRDAEAAKGILPTEVSLVQGDVLHPGTWSSALAECNVLLCATGAKPGFDPTAPYRVDYEGTKNLVNAAKAANIQHFVLVSSLCVSRLFHPLNLFFLILLWKQWAENYLRQSDLTYTIVRPGGLRNDDRDEELVISSADTLFEGSISRTKVAQTCVEALFEPKFKNETIELVGKPTATVSGA